MLSSYKLYALTGSIGSGKSTAANFFREYGAEVIDADDLAREAVLPGTKANEELQKTFGEEFFDEDKTLNRPKLAKIIFNDPKKKQALEMIVHPAVRKLLAEKLKNIKPSIRIVIYIAPLLFEANLDLSNFDKIILLSTDKFISRKRTLARPGMTPELFEQIWNTQLPPEIKELNSDFVIKNNSSLAELEKKCRELYNQLLK